MKGGRGEREGCTIATAARERGGREEEAEENERVREREQERGRRENGEFY